MLLHFALLYFPLKIMFHFAPVLLHFLFKVVTSRFNLRQKLQCGVTSDSSTELYCSDCLTLTIPFPANKVNLDPPFIGTSILLDKIPHMIQTSKNPAFTMKTSRNRVQVTTQQVIVMRQEDVVLTGRAKICYGVFKGLRMPQ